LLKNYCDTPFPGKNIFLSAARGNRRQQSLRNKINDDNETHRYRKHPAPD
jgi:hypothetical protein